MNFVQPIKNKQDIFAMKDHLHKENLRDYTLFTIGINSLLRVSDLLNLQLSDVIENGILKSKILVKEQKTSKSKEFPFNSSIVEVLTEYLSNYHNHKDSCLFPSRKWFNNEDCINRRMIVEFLHPYIKDLIPQIKQYKSIEEIAQAQEVDLIVLIKEFTNLLFVKFDREVEETDIKKQKAKYEKFEKIKENAPKQIQMLLKVKGHDPVGRQSVHIMMKNAGKAVGIKDNISTHSMRKTAAHNIYINNIKTNPAIIEILQKMLNHSSSSTTLRYIGITQDIMDEVYLSNAL